MDNFAKEESNQDNFHNFSQNEDVDEDKPPNTVSTSISKTF